MRNPRLISVLLFILTGLMVSRGVHEVFAEEIDQAFINQAVQFIKSGKKDQAETLAKNKLEKDENSVEALVILAECRIWNDDPYEAIKYLERAAEKSQDKAWDVYLKVSTALLPLLYKQKDIDQRSQEYYEFYLDLQTKKIVADPPRDFDPHGSDALYWRSNMIGDMESGSDFDIHPEPREIREDFSICEITMVILVDPDYGLESLYRDRAHLWGQRAEYSNQPDRALMEQISDLKLSIKHFEPSEFTDYDFCDDSLRDMANAYLKAGKPREALGLVPKDLGNHKPFYQWLWLEIHADALTQLKQFQEAIGIHTKIIDHPEQYEREPKWVAYALFKRSNCYFELGRFRDALADINRSKEVFPEKEYQVYGKYRILLRLGKWDEIQAVIDAPSSDSNFPSIALNDRAKYYMELRQWEKALQDFKAIEAQGNINVDDWEICAGMATVYENLGQMDLAEKYKKRSQELYNSLELWER